MSFSAVARLERQYEWKTLGTIRGSTFPDKLRNNGLPVKWGIKDAKGEIATDEKGVSLAIAGEYIGKITTVKSCAKARGIDFDAITDLTSKEASDLRSYYPQWLYEKSSKSAIVQRLNDQDIQEITQAAELAVDFHLMTKNKFERGKSTFVDEDVYRHVGWILQENRAMEAAARTCNAVISKRVEDLLTRYFTDPTIPDPEFRSMLRKELEQLQPKLRLDIPQAIQKELRTWFDDFIKLLTQDERQRFLGEGVNDE